MYSKNGKTYIDSFCKEIKSQQYDDPIFSLRVKAEDIASLKTDAGGYVRLSMKKRKEVGEYGQTHFLQLDDYVPRSQQSDAPAQEPEDPPF